MPFIITWQGGLSPIFFFFFSLDLSTTYLSLIITLLLLLLQLCLLILPLWVFLRNQVWESSKQGIQTAWSTPIHHVKWWINRFRDACTTYAASEVEPFVILAAFGPLYVIESSLLSAVRVQRVFRHFIIITIIIFITIIILFTYLFTPFRYRFLF